MEEINHQSEFSRLLHTPRLNFLSAVPALLRDYVSLLDVAAEKFGHGTHVYHNYAKAALIAHVQERTGRQCDKEVSGLIAILTKNLNYGEATHRDWRSHNSHLITAIAPKYSGGRKKKCKH
jgi:hypothetical protein